MTIQELRTVLENKGLLHAHFDGVLKDYVSGDVCYKGNYWNNVVNAFGIYKAENGAYVFFITDSERGLCCYQDSYDSEEEACERLYNTILDEQQNVPGNDDKFIDFVPEESFEQYSYYKFKIGDGAMRKKGVVVEYLDRNGNWIEDMNLLGKFIGLDNGFYEITEKEANEIVNRKKSSIQWP